LNKTVPRSLRRAAGRLHLLICAALALSALAGPFLRAELSEEEKRKRTLFLKAREEMRTVATPTPSKSKKKKAKPKAAKHPKKKSAGSKPKRTPEPEETPRKHRKVEEEEKQPEEMPTARPVPAPSASPTVRPTPDVSRPSQPAQVVIEKSGFEKEEEMAPSPTPEERHRFLFFSWGGKSGTSYPHLSRSVRAAIDRAPVLRRRWQYIVVHNSGTRQGNARIFDYYHRHVRRMTNGLAYHFVIGNGTSSGNGEIEVGDRWTRQINGGHVHSDYLNNIALGICLVGDFNRDQPTRTQLAACEELIHYLQKRCGKVNGHYPIVRPHREMNPPRWPTDCPGDEFPYSWFRRFRD
jgi:outer membrane biosynthesis protein TonB